MAAPRIALDSTVLVAGVLASHEHHEASRRELESLARGDSSPLLPRHALIEAYSVLTRLPTAYRLPPDTARQVLAESFEGWPTAGGPEETWPFLARSAAAGVAGGRVYDALILASAVGAGAVELVTWNLRHFQDLAGNRISVRRPGAGGDPSTPAG